MSSSIDEESQRLAQAEPGVDGLKQWLKEASRFIVNLHTEGVHCWCKHGAVCARMLNRLYPHMKLGRPSIERVDESMQWSLSECVNCLGAYYNAKKQMPSKIQDICHYLDCQRLAKAEPKMMWCYELLRFIGPLSDRAVNEKCAAVFKRIGSKKQLCENGIFVGVYQLLGHHDADIRQLAWQNHVHEIKTERDVSCLRELLLHWKNLLRGGMQFPSPEVPQDRPLYLQQLGPLWKGVLGIISKTKGEALGVLAQMHPEFISCAFHECSKGVAGVAGEIDSAIQCVKIFLEGLGATTFSVCPTYPPSAVFDILMALVLKVDKCNLQKSVLSSMVNLARACINTPNGDPIFFRTTHFLMVQVWDNSRWFLPPIRGFALKEGFELVEFAWSMRKNFTIAGHLYGKSLERLLVKQELIGVPSAAVLVDMVHPAAARLASNLIMVDACILAASLSAFKGKMCISMDSQWTGIPLELSASAFGWPHFSWQCVPLIWESMTRCNCDISTMSKISAGFLVAGAALSQIVSPREVIPLAMDMGGGESGGGFLMDPLGGLSGGSSVISGGWQSSEVLEACEGQVVIRGNEASLMRRLLKAIGWQLDRMAEGSPEQLCSEDWGRGWRGLILVSTGIHPGLRQKALRVVKVLIGATGALESEEVATAVVEGCHDLLDAAGKKVWAKELLASLSPILLLLQTVTGCSSGKPRKVSGKLVELIHQVWAIGIRAVCGTDDLSPEGMKEFFSFQESLWQLKVGQDGVSPATMSDMEVWLMELFNLGPRINGESTWVRLVTRILGDVPDSVPLPKFMAARLEELAASPDLGATQKFLLKTSLSRLQMERKSPSPSICDLLSDEGVGTSNSEHSNSKDAGAGGVGQKGMGGGAGGIGGSGSGGGGLGMGQVRAPARGVDPPSLENLWSGFDRAKLVTGRRPETSRAKREKSLKGVDHKKISLKDVLRSTPDEDSDDGMKFTQGGYKFEGRLPIGSKPGGRLFAGFQESDAFVEGGGRSGVGRGEAPKGIKRIELNATDHRMNKKAAGNRNKNAKRLFSVDMIQQQFLSWDIEKLDSPELTWKHVNTIPSVPDKFSSLDQYGKIFRGLLLEELRADMQQQWEELKQRNSRPMSKSMSVQNVQRISDLYNITFSYEPDDRLFFRPDDLLLFTSRPVNFNESLPTQRCTGIVKSAGSTFESDGTKHLEVRIHFKGGAIGSNAPRNDPSSFVRKGWRCQAVVMMSLLTHTREFQALCNLPSLPTPLVNQIVNPLPPVSVPLSLDRTSLPPRMCQDLKDQYNDSQQRAIASAIAGKGLFSLVQGPPGTGKTSAILGMISSLLETIRLSKSQSGADVVVRRGKQKHSPGPPVRILICAQSNAAIDELIARISVGEIKSAMGPSRVPSMVRMGRMMVTHSSVQPYHIDSLCDKQMEINEKTAEASRATNESKKKLEKTVEALEKARAELGKAESRGGGNDNSINALKDKVRQMQGAIGRIRAEIRCGRQTMDQAKRSLRLGVVREAELVFSTLSSAAGDLASLCNSGSVANQVSFDALIVDEAAQALEPSSLVPLRLLKPTGRIVLVGDPRQLPPTVFSTVAAGKNFGQSLFERFEKAGYPVEVLSEQYRMHPKISRFPSKYFYRDRLVDGDGITEETRGAPFHSRKCFSPFMFFDCIQGRESRGRNRGSIENQMEADLVAMLFAEVKTQYKEDVGKVAIIAPYKAQVERIKRCLEHQPMLIRMRAGEQVADLDVEVATVDSFQGREADIVIISLVRAQDRPSGSANVGFLDDARRMNVALTRARRSLWVVGHGNTLKSCKAWNAFIKHAEETGCRTVAQPPFRSLLDAVHSPKPSAPRVSNERIAELEAMFEQQRQTEERVETNSSGFQDRMDVDEQAPVQAPRFAQGLVPKPVPSRKREREMTACGAAEIQKLVAPPKRSKIRTNRGDQHQPPSSVFGAPAENARRENWMKRFGVGAPSKEKGVRSQKPTSRPNTPATSGQSKSSGGKPSGGPSNANDEGGFDITELLGSVVQSNSRPRAFHGHNAGTLDKK